jgi:phosphatidylserine/phosphatidylglycerophosphate/cardiolipin synthase-like enzyme
LLLTAGATCWRVEIAPRAAVFIDMADYFKAAKEAMSAARRSVYLLNWAFEADTVFDPEPGGGGPDSDRFGPFLKMLAQDNPHLDVRVLCWRSSLPVAATQNFFPIADRITFRHSRVRFVLDGKLPLGACHHQKMIVVDDAVAFCGGGDIGRDRWDTDLHLDKDARREKTPADNKCFDSRHEIMALVDGPPARSLGELFRARWERATGEVMAPAEDLDPDAWPDEVGAGFQNVAVGLSRTIAGWRRYRPVRESEALSFASIAVAKRCIYLENQYFTSPIVAEALSARLEEPDGPEVVLVSTQHSPSYFDQLTMDRTRSAFIARLERSDKFGRLRVYSPVTTLGRTIIVHAKLAIIDDRLLRIGSSNMNNRSSGFDTECDLSIEAAEGDEATSQAIAGVRHRLASHWLGCPQSRVERAVVSEGGLGRAIEALRAQGLCRLRPIEAKPLGPIATFIATFHLGDPINPSDSWRPWRRKAALKREVRLLVAKLGGMTPATP